METEVFMNVCLWNNLFLNARPIKKSWIADLQSRENSHKDLTIYYFMYIKGQFLKVKP